MLGQRTPIFHNGEDIIHFGLEPTNLFLVSPKRPILSETSFSYTMDLSLVVCFLNHSPIK